LQKALRHSASARDNSASQVSLPNDRYRQSLKKSMRIAVFAQGRRDIAVLKRSLKGTPTNNDQLATIN